MYLLEPSVIMPEPTDGWMRVRHHGTANTSGRLDAWPEQRRREHIVANPEAQLRVVRMNTGMRCATVHQEIQLHEISSDSGQME
jgi:hypothetical protein